MEPRASWILGKGSTTELYPHSEVTAFITSRSDLFRIQKERFWPVLILKYPTKIKSSLWRPLAVTFSLMKCLGNADNNPLKSHGLALFSKSLGNVRTVSWDKSHYISALASLTSLTASVKVTFPWAGPHDAVYSRESCGPRAGLLWMNSQFVCFSNSECFPREPALHLSYSSGTCCFPCTVLDFSGVGVLVEGCVCN